MKKQMGKHQKMAFKPYNKLWEAEFDKIVSKKVKLLDLSNIQIKLEVHDT